MVAFLDTGNNIIQTKVVSEGSVAQAVVYPREILKEAIACDCKAMILAHNHPGGSIKPSDEDKRLTQRLVDIFHPLDIKIHDHIIVADTKYTSMAQEGHMPNHTMDRANYEPIRVDETVIEIEEVYEIEDDELEL